MNRSMPKNPAGPARRTDVASGPAPDTPSERRQTSRRLSCRFVFICQAGDAAATHQRASLWDISAGGLCLVLSHPVPPGTLLQVAFRNPLVEERLVAVAHVSPFEDDWLVGCQASVPFSEAELQAMRL
jgi:hypothetical protein